MYLVFSMMGMVTELVSGDLVTLGLQSVIKHKGEHVVS